MSEMKEKYMNWFLFHLLCQRLTRFIILRNEWCADRLTTCVWPLCSSHRARAESFGSHRIKQKTSPNASRETSYFIQIQVRSNIKKKSRKKIRPSSLCSPPRARTSHHPCCRRQATKMVEVSQRPLEPPFLHGSRSTTPTRKVHVR